MGAMARMLHSLWRALGSSRLAVILLAALLLAVLLASLFPQMPQDVADGETWLAAAALRYGWATDLLHGLGLFDAYRTPWFLVLLAALMLNTVACTIQRLPRLWRSLKRVPVVSRPEAFYQGFARRADWPVSSVEEGLAVVVEGLRRNGYRPLVERDEAVGSASVYAERGRWAQIGTVVGHAAALLLVIAVVARPALGWQESGTVLVAGVVRPLGHGLDLVQAGPLTVERHPDGQPRDYRVPLSVIVDGSPVVSQTVRINHPLTYRGVAYHLQGYGPAAQVTTAEGTYWLAFSEGQSQELALPEGGLSLRVAYQAEEGNLFVEVLNSDGMLLGSGTVSDGQEIETRGTPIGFDLSTYTVWQVSRDPTFGPAVGMAALLLGAALVSLWAPYRRVWLRVDGVRAQMVGAGDFVGDFELLADAMGSAFEAMALEEEPPEGGVDG
jgi:cytochrome c biogenesis protein